MAQADPEFATNLAARMDPPEPELTPEQDAELAAWEAQQDALDENAREAKQEAPEAQTEQEATEAPAEAQEAPEAPVAVTPPQGHEGRVVTTEARQAQERHDEALQRALEQCRAAKTDGREWEASGWAVRQYLKWLDDPSHTGPGRDVVEERLSDAIDLRHSLKLDEVAALDEWANKERERRQQASRRPPAPPQRSHVDHEWDQHYQPPPPPSVQQGYDSGLSL